MVPTHRTADKFPCAIPWQELSESQRLWRNAASWLALQGSLSACILYSPGHLLRVALPISGLGPPTSIMHSENTHRITYKPICQGCFSDLRFSPPPPLTLVYVKLAKC